MILSKNYKLLFAIAIAMQSPLKASAATMALAPVADTHVRSDFPTTVWGAHIYTETRQNSGTIKNWVYLRFDLSSVDLGQVTNLKLELDSIGAFTATTNVDVYGVVANEAFNEAALTYNTDLNRLGSAFDPASAYGGAPLVTYAANGALTGLETAFEVSSGSVFDFINADADKIVTFALQEQPIATAGGKRWSSKERPGFPAPTLTVATVPEPASLGLLALGGCLSVTAWTTRNRLSVKETQTR